MTFADLWRELEPLGRDEQTGGYRRYSWTAADARLPRLVHPPRGTARPGRGAGQQRQPVGLVGPGNPGNQRRIDAIVTGSHLDSVPDGGGYDGPLGVASALAAVEMLKNKDFPPNGPWCFAVLTEEEGARFRVPCLGSRLITGAIDPETARGLTDDHGITLAEAMTAAGSDASLIGPRDDLLASIGAFVELHVEQGRALAPMGAALGLAEGIWPHGRWRLDFRGPRRSRRHRQAGRPQRPDAALRAERSSRPATPPR